MHRRTIWPGLGLAAAAALALPASAQQFPVCDVIGQQFDEATRVVETFPNARATHAVQRLERDGRKIEFLWNGDHVVIASTSVRGDAIPAALRTRSGAIAEFHLQGDESTAPALHLECDALEMDLRFDGSKTATMTIKAFVD